MLNIFQIIKSWFGSKKVQEPTSTIITHVPTKEENHEFNDLWREKLREARLEKRPVAHESIKSFIKNGLDKKSKNIEYDNEIRLLNTLLFAKMGKTLSVITNAVNRDAMNKYLEGRVPSLKDWASGEIEDWSILPTFESGNLAWARKEGFLGEGRLRESHVAESIRIGDETELHIALKNADLQTIPENLVKNILEAFGTRKEKDENSGLSPEGLKLLWEKGGFETIADKLADMGDEAAMASSDMLIAALGSGVATERELVERIRSIRSEKTRKMMALAIARNAIAHGREEVVEGILEDAGFVLGTDKSTAVTERLASAKIQTVEGKIANFKPDGGISLSESAWMNGKKNITVHSEPDAGRADELIAKAVQHGIKTMESERRLSDSMANGLRAVAKARVEHAIDAFHQKKNEIRP